jgi:hypothetical protein
VDTVARTLNGAVEPNVKDADDAEKAIIERRFMANRKQEKMCLPWPLFCSLVTSQVNIRPNE